MVGLGLNVRRFCRVPLRVGALVGFLPVIVGLFLAAASGNALAAAKRAKTPRVTWTPSYGQLHDRQWSRGKPAGGRQFCQHQSVGRRHDLRAT